MKAEELMIGDYVQDLAGDLCQVIVIDRQVAQVETLTGVHQGDTTRYLHESDGVPLTPEILEKNGWVFDEIDGSYRLPDLGFWIGGRNAPFGFMVSWIYKELYYVHELQHALRLCEIDKRIEL